MLKCFRYTLNQNNQGPAGVLPSGSITGLYVNDTYYGAALIDDLELLADWNAVEITSLQFNTICDVPPSDLNPNPDPALVQLEPAIRQHYSVKMEEVVKPYSTQERETWFIQVEEAKKYLANPNISSGEIPFLNALADERDTSLDTIATIILNKNTEYRSAIGTLLGEQQKLVETIWTK